MRETKSTPLEPKQNEIRRLRTEDSERVSGIISRCLREVNIHDYGEEHISRMLPTFSAENLTKWFEGAEPFVLLSAGQIVGVGALRGQDIQTVFIDPSLHRSGFGRLIMVHLEDHARANGCAEVSLNSSLTSRAFYESLGYVAQSEVYGGVGGKMIAMRKKL